jgi:hypothetical protein
MVVLINNAKEYLPHVGNVEQTFGAKPQYIKKTANDRQFIKDGQGTVLVFCRTAYEWDSIIMVIAIVLQRILRSR